ncbi:MAG: DUF4258 domain-containing protein [Planctomycetes bacterium]|nr:DUF4258 domain-containing protein [Planctomycetota bacterium]
MLNYDEHALFQIQRRGIPMAWVEQTIRQPHETETREDKKSFLRRFQGKAHMLRVVTLAADEEYVIIAYFDRRKPCE